MSHAQEQLHSIHAMLAAGHRSVHLERQSLFLLGGVGSFLAIASEWVITVERFPDNRQRALATLVWLIFWLGGMSLLDYRLTRNARLRRAETVPFVQAQIQRAWWMLLVMGALGTFAMFFYGGGAMVYALWIVLLGLGMYLFGLFSRPLIEWIGLATMLLGVAGLAAGLPLGATRWLMASCFGIGMPLAGWLGQRSDERSRAWRFLALLTWLALVVLPPLLFVRMSPVPAPTADSQVMHLAAGTRVPLRIDLESPLLSASPQAGIELTLTQPVDVVLKGGEPDGRYRIGDSDWHVIRDGDLHLMIDRVTPRLASEGPEVRMHAVVGNSGFERNTR